MGVAGEDLIKLNSFLSERREDRVDVPIKERSLEIFGDEKRLDALRNTVLFDDGRLTLEHLRCFAVAEPMGGNAVLTREAPCLSLKMPVPGRAIVDGMRLTASFPP